MGLLTTLRQTNGRAKGVRGNGDAHGFLPTDLTGLAGWWTTVDAKTCVSDTSTLATVVPDAGDVTDNCVKWFNKIGVAHVPGSAIGAGRDFTNGTASTQPIAKGQSAPGTAPFYLEFDNGPFLDLATAYSTSNAFSYHIVIKVRTFGTASGQGYIVGYAAGGSNSDFIRLNSANGGTLKVAGTGVNNGGMGTGYSNTERCILHLTRDSSGVFTFGKNGTMSSVTGTAAGTYQFDRVGKTFSQKGEIEVAEIIMQMGVVATQNEIDAVVAYCKQRHVID